ncbi:MAG: O-methyltransferase [Planctomycetota bacterium]
MEEFVLTVDDANALPREACSFLHGLILAMGIRKAVEVGTSYGYSGLWLGAALAENRGHLITIDNDPRKLQAARSHFEQAGLSDRIETVQAEAEDALAGLSQPVEFVLLDADKDRCQRYVELVLDKMPERAVIVIDNTLTHAEDLGGFLQWIRASDGFCCSHLPFGNGMEMAVKWPSTRRSHGVFGA